MEEKTEINFTGAPEVLRITVGEPNLQTHACVLILSTGMLTGRQMPHLLSNSFAQQTVLQLSCPLPGH